MTLFIISNLITVKLFRSPFSSDLALPAGIITYPLTFILNDLVTEIFGQTKAKIMVFLGFGMNLLMTLFIQLALWLPSHEATNQSVFEAAFGINSTVVLGSMTAYVISQLIDIKIYAGLKALTNGNHLWLRNNVSTLVSQMVDSFIVELIIFYWGLGLEFSIVLQIMTVSYLYKAFFSIANTPIFYFLVARVKKFLSEEESVPMIHLNNPEYPHAL